MIDIDGIQIEESKLADLIKQLYMSTENDVTESEILDDEIISEGDIRSNSLSESEKEADEQIIAQTNDIVQKMLDEAKKEADKILAKADSDAKALLEKTKNEAKKEADNLKDEILFQKGKLKEQELFFEKKMVILKAGFAQLEADRKAFEKEKREDLENKARANSYARPGDNAMMLFAGVNNLLALKKRYKDLIKIFHPDNLCGDTEVLQLINREYEKLMDEFGWVRKAY